jgi:hypothetical protein
VAYRVCINEGHRSENVFHKNTYDEILKHIQFKMSMEMCIHMNTFLNVYVMAVSVIHNMP